MEIQQFAPDAYLAIGETYRSNSMVFVNDDEALLVDALASRSDGEALRDFVTNDLGKSVRMIVCTHYFSDHLAALKLFPQSLIIAHKNYRQTFDFERYRSEDERAHFVEPDLLVSDELQLRWGRYRLDIFHNPGHTTSTLAIDVPEADMVLIGDTIVGNIVYIMYSTPQMFFPALERIRRRGRSRLLSSHMSVRSSDAINHATHYLKELEAKVLAARRDENGDEAIMSIGLDGCLAPGLKGTEFENRFHKRNLESVIERNIWAS